MPELPGRGYETLYRGERGQRDRYQKAKTFTLSHRFPKLLCLLHAIALKAFPISLCSAFRGAEQALHAASLSPAFAKSQRTFDAASLSILIVPVSILVILCRFQRPAVSP